MRTNVDHGRLARAQARFEPVARVLDQLAQEIKREHGRSAVLEQKSPMEPAAQNVYEVRYLLRQPDDDRLALTFIVTGEDADLLLLRAQERADLQDNRSDPGQVDQHVYRLEKIDEIKEAVQELIVAHLQSRRGYTRHRH